MFGYNFFFILLSYYINWEITFITLGVFVANVIKLFKKQGEYKIGGEKESFLNGWMNNVGVG